MSKLLRKMWHLSIESNLRFKEGKKQKTMASLPTNTIPNKIILQ